MKVYTKTGDAGETGLFGGARVHKDDSRVEAYGCVDELNAFIGVARAAGVPASVEGLLQQIQSDLFVVGAELATVPGHEGKLKMALIADDDVARLERAIDEHEAHLPPLKTFVLPAGCPGAAALHAARTICRRAERRVLTVGRQSAVRPVVQIYLNRLSDLLFVVARAANDAAGVADAAWKPRQRA